MALEIYYGDTLKYNFPRVLSASLCDRLSGERTLNFSVLASRSQALSVGMTAKLDGQYYGIVRVSKKITGGFPITTAQCEHISYLLNDEAYNLVTFVFEGTPAEGMARLLSGTPFTVGVIEATQRVECAFTDQSPLSRRNALMRFIAACGCKVEYDGYRINLHRHRGSTERKLLMDGENVTNLSVTIDSREDTQSYEISLFKMAELQAGDEVNITYTPMGVNVNTRIIGIEYDPFYRYTVRVEVGDYVPSLLVSNATQIGRLRQEFRAADGRLESTIESIDGELSALTQTVSGFDLRIANAEGEVAALSLTVDGFNTRIENAEGEVAALSLTVNGFDTRIENTEGAVSSLSQSLTSITSRVSTAEGNIFTVTQTANKVNWLISSGTSSSNFTMTSRALSLMAASIDLTGYVTISSLSTAGQTTINGANITTGKISTDRIDVSTIKVSTIYTTDHSRVAIKSSGTGNLYIGGDTTWNFEDTFIYGDSSVRFGRWGTWSSHHLVIDTENFCIRPSTVVDWDLGSSS